MIKANQELLDEAIDKMPTKVTVEALFKTIDVLLNPRYHRVQVSISGGSDSDILLDLVERVRKILGRNDLEIRYVFFLTQGLNLRRQRSTSRTSKRDTK